MIRHRGRSGLHSLSGSHRKDFYNEWNAKKLAILSDLKLSLGDDCMDELYELDPRQARMLERGTGKLRKCIICGDVYVNDTSNEIKFGTWLNRNGFKCFFCRNGTKKELKGTNEKFERKREIMQKVWDLYINRLNSGVKITKLKLDS